jgi:hypothetical protein
MDKDEKIKLLEREIELLNEIIRLKDCKSVEFVPSYPQPTYPLPGTTTWPNYPQPYIGDWPTQTTFTC